MKNKRFYNNKKRGEKWTEQPTGRKIYFADKYVDGEEAQLNRKKRRRGGAPFLYGNRRDKILRAVVMTVAAFIIISAGYTAMDVYLERNAMPYDNDGGSASVGISSVNISIKGADCQPLSLDGGVMLSAVIDSAAENGYTSLAFDLKRSDGTIGYESTLATVQAYGAVSSPSGDLAGSVKIMEENDILPVGRISCYKDNVAPSADLTLALMNGGSLYKDSAGSTYLNPLSDGVYNYIRGIIDEAMGAGISVFVLDDYVLPEESGGSGDGFDALAQRLYGDFGEDLRLLRAVDINMSADNAKSVGSEWDEKAGSDDLNDGNAVFCLTAKNPTELKRILDSRGIANYIIFE